MLTYRLDELGVATITWDMQDRPMNILSPEARVEFIARIDEVIVDEAVRGLIITSARDEFIAGADLSYLRTLRGAAPERAMEVMRPMRDALRRLEFSGKPTVAAINGTALGGGLEICLACSRRIAVDRPDAKLGLPEVTLGLLPGAGGTQRLPRLIPAEAALDILLTGRIMSPKAAHEAGVVDQLTSHEDLLTVARDWILAQDGPVPQPWDRRGFTPPGNASDSMALHRYFVAKGAEIEAQTKGLMPAPQAILSAVFEGIRVPFDQALAIEFTRFIGLLTGEVAQNTIRTMFFGMNEVRKLSSRPVGPAPFAPQKIGVIGAGLMGSGLAEVAALAGINVVLVDQTAESANAGRSRVAAALERHVSRGRISAEKAAAAMERITAAQGYDDLAGCEAVIEAVFEDRAIKGEVTRLALAATGPDVLFASNTSKIPISGLAANSARPDRFIGMHFFSPVSRMPLLEIIRGAETSDETLAQAMDLGKLLKKLPITVNDSPGFFTSRCVGTYMNEGLIMLSQGVPAALIENCGRQAGMPVGPLTLADEIGMDLMVQVRRQEQADFDKGPGGEFDTLVQMVENHGRTGRKGGGGFFDYPEDKPKVLWPGLEDSFGGTADADPADIRKRLLSVQALDAARCFDQSVIESPRDADIGSILGWGFARHTGGVVSYIDTYGVAAFVTDCDLWQQNHGARYEVPGLLRQMANEGRTFYGDAQTERANAG